MSEYISKEDICRVLLDRTSANKSCLSNARELGNHEGEQYFDKLVFEDEQIVSLIEGLSSADVRPNIHGHWKRRTYIGNHETVTMNVCSECGKEFGWDVETGIAISDNNFCPNCGADMRKPKGEKGE